MGVDGALRQHGDAIHVRGVPLMEPVPVDAHAVRSL